MIFFLVSCFIFFTMTRWHKPYTLRFRKSICRIILRSQMSYFCKFIIYFCSVIYLAQFFRTCNLVLLNTWFIRLIKNFFVYLLYHYWKFFDKNTSAGLPLCHEKGAASEKIEKISTFLVHCYSYSYMEGSGKICNNKAGLWFHEKKKKTFKSSSANFIIFQFSGRGNSCFPNPTSLK